MASADVAAVPMHTDKARENKHKADWRGWKFMWPFTVVFVFVFIIPIVYAIYISFFKKQMIGGTRFVGVENYARLLQDGQFWSSVGRVALFTCVQVPIMLFLSAAMALALDSMKLHGAKFFRISTFLPYAVPAVVSTLVWGFVYGAKYGLVGSFNDFFGTNVDVLQPSVLLASIGNISTWEFTGYNMLIFYSSLSTIPHSLYEHGSGQRDHHVLHAEHVRVQPELLRQPVELRGRSGHRDGRHHHGHRLRRAAEEHEGADEVTTTARIAGLVSIVKERA